MNMKFYEILDVLSMEFGARSSEFRDMRNTNSQAQRQALALHGGGNIVVHNPQNVSLDDLVINGSIQTDSKKVQKGDIFVCIRGFNVDGHNFAKDVVSKGACILVVEELLDVPILQIQVKDTRKATAIIARLYYQNPTEKFYLIGVTGTNGKTTTTVILEQLFQGMGYKTGLIGTLGYKIDKEYFSSERTTPDIIELNEIFQKMVVAECKIVIMEVSSHSLALDRVYGLSFDIGIFTNLSPEHLDFHKDMQDYGNAKYKLFEMIENNKGVSIINVDDDFGKEIFDRLQDRKICYGKLSSEFGVRSSEFGINAVSKSVYPVWEIRDIDLKPDSTVFSLKYTFNKDNEIVYDNIQSSLIGAFNIYNLTAALIAISEFCNADILSASSSVGNAFIRSEKDENIINAERINAFPTDYAERINAFPTDYAERINAFPTDTGFLKNLQIEKLQSPEGRLQKIHNDKGIDIYIDYAHTPEALSNILDTVRQFTQKRLIVVWGCGGNRDKEKRPQMAIISTTKADLTIITDDNPRLEFSADIIRDIVKPLSFDDPFIIIRNRAEAIKAAIHLAQKGDIVIIAGKGHEKYQEIGNVKYHFDDREIALEVLKQKIDIIDNQLTVPIDLMNLEKLLDITLRNVYLQDNQPLFSSISTDSRSIGSNTLFIALKGDRFDGADFVDDVLAKYEDNWAILQITNPPPHPPTPRLIREEFKKETSQLKATWGGQNRKIYVDDPLLIYGKLAQKYLKLFGAKIITLTGSTGKTTTKEILYNILSVKHKTFKTNANENNQIGVPKNIFKMLPEYEFAVFEIGTSKLGEIAYLSEILMPDFGGVVSINASHLEFLKSLEMTIKEKLSLIHYVKDYAIIPDEFGVNAGSGSIKFPVQKIYTFGTTDTSDFKIINFQEVGDDMVLTIQVNQLHANTEQNGRDKSVPHNPVLIFNTSIKLPFLQDNIAFAVALATLLGIDDQTIEKGLKKELYLENRMEIINTETKTLLFDCYNANPCSMKAAINFWIEKETEKPHLAILGEMRELGEQSEMFHKEIGELLDNYRYNKNIVIIGVGNLARFYNPDYHFENVDLLIESDVLNQINSTIVLIKGSNSINLSKLKGRL